MFADGIKSNGDAILRGFNKEWKYGLNSFGDYFSSMCSDLNAIQKNYGEFFDARSVISVKDYIRKFEIVFNIIYSFL